MICAQRFLAHHGLGVEPDDCVRAALARVDQMSFRAPMHIGECAVATAHVKFTSHASVEVHVDVHAESAHSGRKRHTNHADLWYVPVRIQLKPPKLLGIVAVPKLVLAAEDEQRALARYQFQKETRAGREAVLSSRVASSLDMSLEARCELSQLVLPSDCDQFGFLRGGVLMKLMDNCAGIVAFRHCRTNVVTISVEATDFRVPVPLGSLIRVVAFATFASSRSLEIELVVSGENLVTGEKVDCTTTAIFVFVSLDKHGASQNVPPLEPKTPAQQARFEEGRQRYELRKNRR